MSTSTQLGRTILAEGLPSSSAADAWQGEASLLRPACCLASPHAVLCRYPGNYAAVPEYLDGTLVGGGCFADAHPKSWLCLVLMPLCIGGAERGRAGWW